MCQTTFKPEWNLLLQHSEMRLLSLALAGKLKPESTEARDAMLLLKAINEQRLARLNEMSIVLEGLDDSLVVPDQQM